MLGAIKNKLRRWGCLAVLAISLIVPPLPATALVATPLYPNAAKSGYVSFDNRKGLLDQLRASVPAPDALDGSYDYYIDNYDIDMVVGEDNVYTMTEKLKVYFNKPRHGIIRNIPTYNEVTRLDGSKTSNRARIDDIEVSAQADINNDGRQLSIKIGDPDTMVTGDVTYEIKYKYDIGQDKLANADELYFNLIGSEWDTAIRKVNFTIHMPKAFDRSKLGFSSGAVGSTDSSNILYTVDGNTIYGINKNYLSAGQALTVRLTLPEGYYQRAATSVNWWADNYWWLAMVVAGVLSLITIGIWWRHGRAGLVTNVVSYGPPDGMNSLDVGYVYNGYTSNNSVTSLLIYLANKGYLKIHLEQSSQDDGKASWLRSLVGKQESYRIDKVKDYDGGVKTEKIFFNGLFDGGRTSVTEDDLYDEFYSTVNVIKLYEDNSALAKSFYVDNNKYRTIIGILMAIVMFALPLLGVLVLGGGFNELKPGLMGAGLACIISVMINVRTKTLGQGGKAICSAVGVTLGAEMVGAFFIYASYAVVAGDLLPHYMIMTLVCYLSAVAMAILIVLTLKRSEAGDRLLGQVRGFKDFLKTVEKDRIEAMVADNPNFFYDILPYAYVLDVADVWIKKFESMNLRAPDWYDSSAGTAFSASTMATFMDSTMSNISDNMSSSSSSGGSGGGSSGGGSGGGGGSSW